MPSRMSLPRFARAACLAAALAACEKTASGPSDNGTAQARTITAAEMRDWIARLSDDSMMGRPTPGPEIDEAALVIAARFQQLGLAGAFGGSFIQRYPAPTTETAPNVGGLLEGGDPQLKNEVVVIVAHFDHVGRAWPVSGRTGTGAGSSHGGTDESTPSAATVPQPAETLAGVAPRPWHGTTCTTVGADSICNGANDNASGTAAVLELAEAYAGVVPRPMRSVLFLAVSGEEHGLYGSQYFVDNPPTPLANVVAVLDIDMIGRNSEDSILVGGLDRSTLGDLAAATAVAHPEEGLRLTSIAAGGSDDVPFAGRGVPSLMFFNGLHPDYHRATDTVDLIDAELAARTARIVFYTGLDILSASGRPQLHAGRRAAPRAP